MKIFIGIITYIIVVIFGLLFFYGTKPRNNDSSTDSFADMKTVMKSVLFSSLNSL